MKAFLLVAHGSRSPRANAEIESLAADIRKLAGNDYEFVEYAFLEWASPSIPDAIDELVGRGATNILLCPYFLSGGKHVTTDIPQAISDASRRHTSISIELAPWFGTYPSMAGIILDHVRTALK